MSEERDALDDADTREKHLALGVSSIFGVPQPLSASQHLFAVRFVRVLLFGGGLGCSPGVLCSSCYLGLLAPKRGVTGRTDHPCTSHWQQTPTQHRRVEHLSVPLEATHHLIVADSVSLSHSVSITLSFNLSSFHLAAAHGNGCSSPAGCQC